MANVQGDRGKAYACHPFTITHEVKKECSPGFVMNDAGRCVCPEGTTFRNGQCSPDGGVIVAAEEPKPCVLLKGQIRTEDGRCVCPRGAGWRTVPASRRAAGSPVQAAAGPDSPGGRTLHLPAWNEPHPWRVPQDAGAMPPRHGA